MNLFKNGVFWQITCVFLVKQFELSALLRQQPHQQTIAKNCVRTLNTTLNTQQPFAIMNSQKKIDVFTYESGSSSVAFVTTPNLVTARNLALGLVERKLAACVNIIPGVTSIYMWDNKINEDNEHLMMIKTQTILLNDLTQYVRSHHPYSVAEVITLPIDKGNDLYLKWLAESVISKGTPEEVDQRPKCDDTQ